MGTAQWDSSVYNLKMVQEYNSSTAGEKEFDEEMYMKEIGSI